MVDRFTVTPPLPEREVLMVNAVLGHAEGTRLAYELRRESIRPAHIEVTSGDVGHELA